MNDVLILVDEQDKEIGTEEKIDAHRKGLLHRAFSLFIYDSKLNKMLIQRRAINKYHSGGLWTNACCSHPRKGEDLNTAIYRRTIEELGVSIPKADYEIGKIKECGKFTYRKDFGELTEYEIDHVFAWLVDSSILQFVPNKDEIEDLMWIDIHDLMNWLEGNPDNFTAWFFPAYEIFINDVLSKPTMMCSPISSSLFDVIQKKKNEVLIF
ncbi:MAG: isopentenyl-diphosphate Delta-isomerase [Acutalibacteraceae bacterium]|jgi:isopentenyl-diphosphate Delta-isomerase